MLAASLSGVSPRTAASISKLRSSRSSEALTVKLCFKRVVNKPTQVTRSLELRRQHVTMVVANLAGSVLDSFYM